MNNASAPGTAAASADSMTFSNNSTGTIKWKVGAPNTANDFHLMVLPTGTQLTSGSKIEYPVTANAFDAASFVITTSTDQLFKWPSILGKITTVTNIHNADTSGQITNVTSRDYTYSNVAATEATRGFNIGVAGDACGAGEKSIDWYNFGLTAATKDFSNISISNTAINLQSPSSKAFT